MDGQPNLDDTKAGRRHRVDITPMKESSDYTPSEHTVSTLDSNAALLQQDSCCRNLVNFEGSQGLDGMVAARSVAGSAYELSAIIKYPLHNVYVPMEAEDGIF